MISPKKLITMAKKWRKLAASKRKRISFTRTTRTADAESCSTSSVVEKGHFKMAEDEFGLPSSGPITLPCDAVFMEYVVSLIRRLAEKDVKKSLLMSLATGRCLPSSIIHQEKSNQQSQICSCESKLQI